MRVFFNEDPDHFGYECYCNHVDVDESVLKDYIYSFRDTDVTDLVFQACTSISTTPSKVMVEKVSSWVEPRIYRSTSNSCP